MIFDINVWVKKTGVWHQSEESINLQILSIARYRKVLLQHGKKTIECTRIVFHDGDIAYMVGKHNDNKAKIEEALSQLETEREENLEIKLLAN